MQILLGKENLENMAEYLIKWDCVTFWHILSGSFLVDSNLSCIMLTPSNSRPSEALNSETILMVTYFVCLSGLGMIFLSELVNLSLVCSPMTLSWLLPELRQLLQFFQQSFFGVESLSLPSSS